MLGYSGIAIVVKLGSDWVHTVLTLVDCVLVLAISHIVVCGVGWSGSTNGSRLLALQVELVALNGSRSPGRKGLWSRDQSTNFILAT